LDVNTKKQQLQSLDLIDLAGRCKQVEEKYSSSVPEIAEKAREFKMECQTFAIHDVQTKDYQADMKTQKAREALKSRVAEFLSRYDWWYILPLRKASSPRALLASHFQRVYC